MQKSARNSATAHALWVAVACFCCVLITFASIIQVEHVHLGAQSDCAACHAVHTVVAPPVPQSLPVTIWIVAALIAALPAARARYSSQVSLFTRPPPVNVAFA
jgi:hypothetical protein